MVEMDPLRIALIGVAFVVVVGIYLFERARRARLERRRRRDDFEDDLPDALLSDNLRRVDEAWSEEVFSGRDEPVGFDRFDSLDRDMLDDGASAPGGRFTTPTRHGARTPVAEEKPAPRQRVAPSSPPPRAEPARPAAAPRPTQIPARAREASAAAAEPKGHDVQDVIILTIMAKEGQTLPGDAIAAAMSACGLHHGRMGVFHAYRDGEGAGEPWFSVANVVEPGTFDAATMAGLRTPGLALFMQLPGPASGPVLVRYMMETGHQLSQHLGARLCDERRQLLTEETAVVLMKRVARFG